MKVAAVPTQNNGDCILTLRVMIKCIWISKDVLELFEERMSCCWFSNKDAYKLAIAKIKADIVNVNHQWATARIVGLKKDIDDLEGYLL